MRYEIDNRYSSSVVREKSNLFFKQRFRSIALISIRIIVNHLDEYSSYKTTFQVIPVIYARIFITYFV